MNIQTHTHTHKIPTHCFLINQDASVLLLYENRKKAKNKKNGMYIKAGAGADCQPN